jgi:nicotinamide-nucleotide amidase
MHAHIISIGDELLKGHRTNTNAPFIARELGRIGIPVDLVVTCSDDPEAIRRNIAASLGEADLVLVTGGLGPTKDDRTRRSVQELLGRGLDFYPDAYERIAELFRRRGREVTDDMRSQAMVIEGAVPIPNTRGTAPGMIIDCGERFGHRHLVLMPGVPVEMEAMMELAVIPFFAPRSGSFIVHTPIMTMGIGESVLAGRIARVENSLPEHTTLSYLPHAAGVSLMVSTIGPDRESVEHENRLVVDAIAASAGDVVYATRDASLEEVLVPMLVDRGLTVAIAESCTGGLVSSRLTDVPGSSECFLEGRVTYGNEAKQSLLGVLRGTLEQHGAVSEPVAVEMARGCLERSGADLAVATTGIAGPGGGTPDKPVGTLCLAVAARSTDGSIVLHPSTVSMHGDRRQNKIRFSEAALRALLETVRGRR